MTSFRPYAAVAVLCVLACLARGEEHGRVEVGIRFHGEGAAPGTIRLSLDPNTEAANVLQATLEGGRGVLAQAPESEWTVSVDSAGFWSAAQPVKFPAAGETASLQLDVWPSGVLTGTIAMAAGEPRPETVALQVESPPVPVVSPAALPAGTKLTCPVDADGRWTCSAPAAKLDLTLRARAMTPHYRWDVVVPPGGKKDLGKFELRRGASFIAFLDSAIARTLKRPATARLLRPVAGGSSSQDSARLAAPVAESTFDRRGWVQLASLPAGSYVLEVRADGFAPAHIGPVEIYEGKETAFRKLIELQAPLEVVVTVQPPSDAGRPWRVGLARISDFTPADASYTATPTDDSGSAAIADQAPELYSIEVEDGSGNPVWRRDVRIDSAADARVAIALDLQPVRGRVVMGDEPLPSTVWFGTRNGAVRTRIETDGNGRFEGHLPRLGAWTVEITGADAALRTLLEVDVREDDELVIRVPDTLVSGWVVTDAGRRVTRGSVDVMSAGRAVHLPLTANGEFRVRGLPPGTARLVATDQTGGGSSAAVAVQVEANRPREGVELRIERTRGLTGRVLSGGQPAVGAQVSVAGPDFTGAVRETVTDGEGRFSVAIPDQVTRAHVTVAAPSRTLQAFDVPVSRDPVVLDVERRGGRLELDFQTPPDARLRITRNGIAVPLPKILSWVSSHGVPLADPNALQVPNLAPGHYRICNGAAPCVDGSLPAGGTLRLDVP